MRSYKYIFWGVGLLIAVSNIIFSSCKKDDNQSKEHHFTEYDDSTHMEITDSIIVKFGDFKWKTLTYTSNIENDPSSIYKWATIRASKPGSRFPQFYLKIYLKPGTHTNYMTMNDPGMGYIVPGRLTGDVQGGAIYYYKNEELSAPDGTKTSDWWPLELKTEVLKYDENTKQMTARVIATMFDYASFVNREVQSVDQCEKKTLDITFGALPLK